MTDPNSPNDFPALWVRTVNAGRIDDILGLYDEGASLLPTFSPRIRTGRDGIADYFAGLLAKSGAGVTLDGDSVASAPAGGSVHVVTGLYSFEQEVDGSPRAFPARFTFVVDLSRDAPILHHHSSELPGAGG